MNTKPELLYLDLIKKALSYALWEDPGMPIETFAYKKAFLTRILTNALSRTLRLFNYQAVRYFSHEDDQRKEGRSWPRYGETMIGLKRLDNIQFCVESVIQDNIEGDLIEAGVWRGGAAIFMQAILAAHQVTNRRVIVADSFEGLPKPNDKKYPQDKGDQHYVEKFLSVSKEEVEANFKKYGLLDEQVVFLKGWFKDTIPTAPLDKLAVIRIDADMYKSTNDAIINLYPKLSKGGFCIVDDYIHTPCRQAIDEFRAKEKITSPITEIDWTGVFWQKE